MTAARISLYRVSRSVSSTNGFVIGTSPELIATLFSTVTNAVTKLITFSSKAPLLPGFYVFSVACNGLTFDSATVTYQSDSYACPYDSQYPDSNQNF